MRTDDADAHHKRGVVGVDGHLVAARQAQHALEHSVHVDARGWRREEWSGGEAGGRRASVPRSGQHALRTAADAHAGTRPERDTPAARPRAPLSAHAYHPPDPMSQRSRNRRSMAASNAGRSGQRWLADQRSRCAAARRPSPAGPGQAGGRAGERSGRRTGHAATAAGQAHAGDEEDPSNTRVHAGGVCERRAHKGTRAATHAPRAM